MSSRPVVPYPRLPYKELIFAPGQLRSSHAPSIVELPDGELFAVWYAATSWSPNAVIWSSRRPARADGWTKPVIIHIAKGRSAKNPVLFLNQDKKLLLFWAEERRWFKWKRDRLQMKVSDDMGYKWGKARDAGAPSGFMPRTHPIKLSDGRVILPIYTDWSTSSAVITSKDGGLTWDKPSYIHFLLGIQPTVIQRSDSSLFALMRTGTWPRLAWQAISEDLGHTWKDRALSGVKNPGSSIEMIKLKSGNVVLVFNDSRNSRAGISIAISYDEGRTWASSRVIEYTHDRVHCYPSVMQGRDGLIHVLYSYDGRKSIAHFVTDERWIKGPQRTGG